jgi:hypothetical protein
MRFGGYSKFVNQSIMLKKPSFVAVVVSLILFVYCALIGFNIFLPVAYFIFASSPVLIIWLTYTIIHFGVYDGHELQSDEEWGYGDKNKNELDLF